MKRLVAVLGVVGLSVVGGLATAAPASAAEAAVCVHLDVNIAGQGQVQDICLPPAS